MKFLLRYRGGVTRASFLRRSLVAIALPCFATVPMHAQDQDAQLWTTATAEFDLGSGTSLSAHMVARFSEASDGLYQAQFGVDLERDLGGGFSAGGGYSYVPSYEQGRLTTREHRIRQQLSLPLGEIAGGKLAGRLRLEQRWRDDGEDLKFRLRPRIAWTRPLGTKALELRLFHESFVNLNDTDWAQEARYDRMRNGITLRRNVAAGLKAEVGYLNQYVFQGARPDEIDHALTLALTFSR